MKNLIDFTNFTKKIFASAVLTSMLATLLMSASVNLAFAAGENPTTNSATSVTSSDATLNGTNGTSASNATSFWVSTSPIVVPTFPGTSVPSGVYSTPALAGAAANANYSSSLSITTTAGYPSNMPAITPGTTYYYVAWSNVGADWYPGAVTSFTTLKLSQAINFSFASTTIKYGDADFTVTATSDSALPVTVTSGTAIVCTVSGFTIHIASAGTCTLNADQAGNGTYDAASQVSQTFTVGKKDITISGGDFAEANKDYDGTTNANIKAIPTAITYAGAINGDDSTNVTLDLVVGTGALASKNASTTATVVTFSGYTLTGSKAANYNLTNQPANETQTVTKSSITVTPSASTKLYDSATSSSGIPTVTTGAIQAGDTANFTQSYVTANAAVAKPMTATGTVTDSNNGENYAVTFANANVGVITQKELTVTGLNAENKIYDTNTTAIGTGTPVLVGLLAADISNVNIGGSVIMNFSDSAVANAKTVNVTGLTISGTSSNSYSLTQPTLTANITAKDLTISGLSVASKVYDGLTTAIMSGVATLVGVINTDQFNVRLGGNPITANFDTKNASTSKLVNITGYSASGTAATNYNLIAPTSTADITKKTLTVTVSAANKVYDANTNAVVTFSDDRILGDSLTVTGTASFSDKTVANGKTVTVTGLTLTGTDAANYTLATTTISTTANITKKDLTAIATSSSKTYDANALASSTVFSTDVVSGDIVNYTFTSSSFSDKNVGVAKTVTVSGIAFGTATDTANYNLLNTTTTTTADINARDLVVTSVAANKVYDSITTAAVISLITNMITGDLVGTVSSLSSNFADKNVGNGKLVTTGVTFAIGTDNTNYNLPLVSTTTANITKRTLNMLSASGTDKEYDGTRYGYAVITDDRMLGDVINYASTTSLFDTKNTGDTKSITVSGITATGTDAINYILALPNNITTPQNVKITKKSATITAENKTKVYDTVDPVLTATTTGMIAGDVLTGSLIRTVGENVGTYDINQGTMTAGNDYVTTFATGTFTITKATPTIAITPVADKYANDANFNLVATTTSGLAITLSLTGTSTPCTLTANTVHMTGATGTCQVIASVTGDANYVSATTTTSFTVLDIPVVILPPVVIVSGGSFGGLFLPSTNLNSNPINNNGSLQVLGASKFKFNKNLKLGMKTNNDVKELQKVLNTLGLYTSTSTNGKFDTQLFNAVKAYQKTNKVMPVSGYFGPLTRAVINK